MDYKEKYESGLECIQEILSGAGDSIKTSILRKRLQPFFPELKESDDERIRKALINILNEIVIDTNYKELDIDYSIRDMIAWLEKQGKQTHAELSQQGDKDLILRDLCARLPYNVWVSYKTKYDDIERATILNGNYVRDIMEGTSSWIDFKPYLRPLSSMTEEEKDYVVKHSLGYTTNIGGGKKDEKLYFHFKTESYDWLNKNMFDFRGLIPKGLALSTEIHNPYVED